MFAKNKYASCIVLNHIGGVTVSVLVGSISSLVKPYIRKLVFAASPLGMQQ